MFTAANRKELDDFGVTVVPGVISPQDCDRHQAFFRKWLGSFPEGQFPQSRNSVIQRYSCGHMQPAWEVRLAVKHVFSEIWGTEKLLSSTDAIGIGRPPEEGQEAFWSQSQQWIHVDQMADRKGLHAYQAAVYLESCEEDDWTFEVIKGSHKYFEEFMTKTPKYKWFTLSPRAVKSFEDKGCERKRIPCPKGGIVLWDSRLFHANARPIQGRQNPGRWRFVVFLSMSPASWASPADLEKKKRAYDKLLLTSHWPSQDMKIFASNLKKGEARDPNPLTELPEVAKCKEAKQLAGVLAYEEDDKENEPKFRPVWNEEILALSSVEKKTRAGRKRSSNSNENYKKTNGKIMKKQTVLSD